jgi:tripartite-type tricarboxylate transporter receptor subunit TctC
MERTTQTRGMSGPQLDRRTFALGLAGAIAAPSVVSAQVFPAKTIQIIVPNAAGGVNDVLARIIAQKLQDQFGKPVVVENRAGAGGDIGTESVLKAEPDGHTLVMGSIALTLKPALYKTLRFDPRTEVTSVARLANQPMIIVSKPDLPVSNLADFIQLAKANPGKLSFGTPGPGTPQHFGAEMLCAQTGLKMIHVPYRGAVPAMTDIMSGQIDLYYATETSGGAHIAAGRMKPLAVTGEQRISTFPEVKTVVEFGLPKATIGIWYGLFGPPKMPDNVLTRLATELKAMSETEDYRVRLAKLALQNTMSSPAEMKAQIEREIPQWQEVARAAGIKQED